MPPSQTSLAKAAPAERTPPQVALLIESSRAYGRGVLLGIAQYIRQHGPWSVSFQERGLGNGIPAWLETWRGDGIIARIEDAPMADAIQQRGIPVVDVRGLLLDRGIPLIETDDQEVVQLIAAHLMERGFKQFAFCGFVGANYSDRRSAFFLRAIQSAGYPCHIYHPPNVPCQGTTYDFEQHGLFYGEHLADWLRQLPKPLGLMACNDIRGQQILNACRRIGIAVPDELAVIGVDNDEVLCELSNPPLSSVIPNTSRIGFQAAALLNSLIIGEPPPTQTIYVPPLGVATRRSTDVLAISDRHISTAIRYIRDHAAEGIQVADLVKVVPLSRSVLERRFIKFLGRSPKSEILRVQLLLVKKLLRETDLPIAAIADKTGFKHAEYMNVIFKKKTGLTPGQYRSQTKLL